MVFRFTKIRYTSFAHRIELHAIDFLVGHLAQAVGCKVFALLVHTVRQIDKAVVTESFDLRLDQLVEIRY